MAGCALNRASVACSSSSVPLMLTKLPVMERREQSGDSSSPAYGMLPHAGLERASALLRV